MSHQCRKVKHAAAPPRQETVYRSGDVFRIVNEKTRQLVENPLEVVMRSGAIVGLANQPPRK